MNVVEVAADECDACPAVAHVKAYVYAQMPSGKSVSYCCHHGNEYLPELTRQADIIVDLRHTLHGH
jgi:hypothetical protein